MRKWFLNFPIIERAALVISLVLILGSFIKSVYYTRHYGGTDLRVNIVGARLLHTGHSPYSYHWLPGDSETLVNPNGNSQFVNGVTGAPGILYLQSTISWMKYPIARICWTIIQYLLMLYIFIYCFKNDFSPGKKELYVFLVSAVFFFSSALWLENIERGQVYVFYAFLFCVIYQLLHNDSSLLKMTGGLVLAAAIYCRPTFIVFVIPFVWRPNKWFFTGFAIAAILFSVHGILHLNLWKDYFTSVRIYTGFERIPIGTPEVEIPKFSATEIEGATNLTLYNSSFICGGMQPLASYFRPTGANTGYIFIALYLLAILSLLFAFRKELASFDIEEKVLLGFLFYISAEYFIPNDRGGYNPIQWAFPVILMLKRQPIGSLKFILIICGLCLMVDFPYYFPGFHSIGEVLLVYCLAKNLSKKQRENRSYFSV